MKNSGSLKLERKSVPSRQYSSRFLIFMLERRQSYIFEVNEKREREREREREKTSVFRI
jgi:hypothetical protein